MQSLAPTLLPFAHASDAESAGVQAGEESDHELVARVAHHPQAFAVLYRRYVDLVYRYCHHRLGSKEAAEDATSRVFAKALAALPSYRANRPFRSWLFAIAHNTVVDACRARRAHQPLDVAAEIPDAASSPEEQAVSAEADRSVRLLLAHLTPDQARVVELRLAGLSETEIAAVLGRRPAAVRALQFRALTRMRALLGIAPTAGRHADA